MSEPTWYFIGPDKTGFDCADNCCAAFSEVGGVCAPYPCSTSARPRNYFCPNPTFPTGHHIYKWNGNPSSSVTIAVNSIMCPSSSTTCFSYTPSSGLNVAGRVGTGCSQTTVLALYNCTTSSSSCDISCGECYSAGGFYYYPRICVETSSGCVCSSASSYNTCTCTCLGLPECACNDCTETCFIICDGDVQLPFNCCEDASNWPTCACGDLSEGCGACEQCVGGVCQPLPCPPCSEGFTCSCGSCVCNAQSTCCVSCSKGWSYSSANRICLPCYEGWQDFSPPNCCYDGWRRKNCTIGEVCCNDGRCYEEDTVLCDIRPPPYGPTSFACGYF